MTVIKFRTQLHVDSNVSNWFIHINYAYKQLIVVVTLYIHIQSYGDDRKRNVVQVNGFCVVVFSYLCFFQNCIYPLSFYPVYTVPNVRNRLHS